MVFSRSQFYFNSLGLCGLYISRILLYILFLLPASLVFSNPLENFCITKIQGKLEKKVKSRKRGGHPPALIANFIAGGKPYYFIYGRNYLDRIHVELFDGKDNLVSSFSARQKVTGIDYIGRVLNLKISKTGWLWMNGEDIDYIAHVDLNKSPPVISKPIDITSLFDDDCISTPIIGCGQAVGVYSESLQRIFVSSARGAYFGLIPPLSYQIIDGVVKPLPTRLHNAKRRDGYGGLNFDFSEVPLYQGVVFQDMTTNEPLFYDGSTVKSLLPLHVYKAKQAIEESRMTSQVMIAPYSKRSFLKIYLYNKKSNTKIRSFIFEVMPDITLREISLPVYIEDDNFLFSEFPQTGPIFWKAIGDHSILVETNGQLQVVIEAIPKNDIFGLRDAELSQQKFIEIKAPYMYGSGYELIKETNRYFIVRKKLSTQCVAQLNPNNPIVFNIENRQLILQ